MIFPQPSTPQHLNTLTPMINYKPNLKIFVSFFSSSRFNL